MKKFWMLLTLAMGMACVVAWAAAQKTVTLSVQNMTCQMCPITVRKSLEKVPGVRSASVDFGKKTATVTYDPDKTKIEDLTRATKNAGYPSVVKQ
jgi:mercuric ion binding protein